MPVLDGAEPFARDGDGVGVLLCHGFTGTPQSLRPWAEHLAAAGRTVSLPRLPGHGTRWQDLNRTTWHDWFAAVDAEFVRLRATCDAVVVGGLSMGGALALRLAQVRGADVAGLVLVNPALRIEDRRLVALPALRRMRGSVPGIGNDVKQPGSVELAYDRTPLHALASLLQLFATVRADLSAVSQPLLVLHSVEDHVVPPANSRAVLEGVSSPDRTEILLHDSYHVATLDHDAPTIFEESVRFADRVVAGRAGSAA